MSLPNNLEICGMISTAGCGKIKTTHFSKAILLYSQSTDKEDEYLNGWAVGECLDAI